MTPNAPISALHQTILQAWECAFAGMSITYLSGPITTGLRQVRRLQSGSLTDEAKAKITKENCENLKSTATRLRVERSEIVVEPASLDIVDWSQKDYLVLWESLIEKHTKLILFMPGWEYSLGCATEFTRAIINDVRTETVSGSPITLDDAVTLLQVALKDILSNDGAKNQKLEKLASGLCKIIGQLESICRPRVTTNKEHLRKDASLDFLAETMNVAQFVSFSPKNGKPKQEFARIVGLSANESFRNVNEAIETLLRSSSNKSVNVRSFEPSNPQSREFIYGLKKVSDAVDAVNRLTSEGLNTIINETINVNDGGVSGVLMGNALEFSPDDTPRCVEKPGTVSLPRGWGRELLGTVYGFPIGLDTSHASRLEFSIHPEPRGWRKSNILVWEYSNQTNVEMATNPVWPNNFSRMLGDKVFGLLVAHHIGLPIPLTTVINRRIAPFSFGRATQSGETWIRTAPNVQVPGKFTTNHGWLDPFELLELEDPQGITISSVISQQGVRQRFSGALIVGADGQLIIEGKRGEGETLMLGVSSPEQLPSEVIGDVEALFARAKASIGNVRFEWVHDGEQAWIVQMHSGATDSMQGYITTKEAKYWQTFDVDTGLEKLREALKTLPSDTGVVLSERVGLTSHFADVLRRANVAARMNE